MNELTEEQQNAIDQVYRILEDAGLGDLTVGSPRPKRRVE